MITQSVWWLKSCFSSFDQRFNCRFPKSVWRLDCKRCEAVLFVQDEKGKGRLWRWKKKKKKETVKVPQSGKLIEIQIFTISSSLMSSCVPSHHSLWMNKRRRTGEERFPKETSLWEKSWSWIQVENVRLIANENQIWFTFVDFHPRVAVCVIEKRKRFIRFN